MCRARNPKILRIGSVRFGHLNASQLVDYLSGLWTPNVQREIEVHLSQCDLCTMLARQVYIDGIVLDSRLAKPRRVEAKAMVAAANAARPAAALLQKDHCSWRSPNTVAQKSATKA